MITILEPEILQVQSPVKRREYSVTEELNLDEHKEQKVPKKKKPSLPAPTDVPEVFMSFSLTILRLRYHSTGLKQ